jgi:hypothetical protein
MPISLPTLALDSILQVEKRATEAPLQLGMFVECCCPGEELSVLLRTQTFTLDDVPLIDSCWRVGLPVNFTADLAWTGGWAISVAVKLHD